VGIGRLEGYLAASPSYDGGERTYVDLEPRTHHLWAAYKPDVSIGMAVGLPCTVDADGYSEVLSFDWAAFPDHKVTDLYADTFLNGMLIDRRVLVQVDGRVLMPVPRREIAGMDVANGPRFANNVKKLDVDIARVVHCFERHGNCADFNYHLEQAGFIVEE